MTKSMQHYPQARVKNSKAIASQVARLDAGSTSRSSGPAANARNRAALGGLSTKQANVTAGSRGTQYKK
jgi:hypothetical protein